MSCRVDPHGYANSRADGCALVHSAPRGTAKRMRLQTDFSASLSNIGSSLTGYTGTTRYPSAPM